MTEDNDDQTLDEHIDEAASDAAAWDQFQNIEWGALSDNEFEMKSQQVFTQMRAQGNLRSVAAAVRKIDAETEARKRRKAEPKDIEVTLRSQ